MRRRQEVERRRREIARRRELIGRQIAELRASLETEEDEERILGVEDQRREVILDTERRTIATRRGGAE